MTHTTATSLDKFTGTGYLDTGESKDKFGCFSWSQNDFISVIVNLETFHKDDSRDFRLL